MKINGFIVMLASASLTTAACSEEIAPPADGMPAEGQKVTFCISADFPDISPDSKVILDDSGVLSWTGEESATLIFGKAGANNSNNPTLPSVSPGVFQGEVTIPSGYTVDNLQGIVIPSENGANFRGLNGESEITRIRMYVDAAQTCDGTPPMDQCPFFSELTSSQLTSTDGVYTLPGITLKTAADLIRMNVYGKHPDMEADEVLKSIRLDNGNAQYLTSTVEYKVNNGGWSINRGNGGTYVKVTMENEATIADKTSENGITAWAAITLYGIRSINKITITTDKAVYIKEVAKDLDETLFNTLKVYKVGLNLANGYTRDALVKYSADGGQTWLESIPETYSTLAVKTVTTANLSADVLNNIKNSIAGQASPVALDLRQAKYESTVFPAVFNGTEDSRSTLLKSISFPNNVKEVAANAFEYCSSLESVDLSGITTINTKSFHWAGLKTLNVPHTVTSFPGHLSFGCCHYLTDIYYDSPAPLNGSVNQAQFAWAKMTSDTTLPGEYGNASYPELYPSEGSCKITFGPNVKQIARNMFKYNKGIAEAVFYCAPVINIAGFFELNNIHTFDFSLVSEVASGNNTNTGYMKNIGNLAKAAGKTLRILVPAGCTDTYKNAQPFKYMVNTLGWTIVEQASGTVTSTDVRIGTYNVRYYNGDTSSATNKWEVRKERLVQSVRDIDFDIFGVQEAMDPQIVSLDEMLGDTYGTAYFRPQTGASSDSSVGIFYKKSDWILTDVKNFWISSTPDARSKGDTGEKGNFYRGAICGTLIHKTTNARLFFMDSHGCLNPTPNETYAHVYLDKEAALNPDGLPSFFVGDLNTKPESSSSTLFRTYWNDTYMTIDESLRQGCEFTYNGFKNIDGTSRIDYVYYRGENVTPTLYKCDNTLYNDLYPSDHWPVFADFTITPATETEQTL